MLTYLKIKGKGRQSLARGTFAVLVNSSDARAKLIGEYPEFEDTVLSARVIDTWVSGDTSSGARKFTEPLGIHLRAIAEYLISERRLTKEEFETAGSGQLPAMYLAEFLERGESVGGNKDTEFATLAAVLEEGDTVSLRFLDFIPLPTRGAYSVVETRKKLERGWGEDDADFQARIGNALSELDDQQVFETNQDWFGLGVLTDFVFLLCLRPPIATPVETPCVYHATAYQIAENLIDSVTTLVSAKRSRKSSGPENIPLIHADRLNFFLLSEIRSNIENEYEERV
ncbi:MAG: hypothetical protein GKR90_27765 [Pseudomonadales bacterium]|nr:hypothetical protein [Pseudomonadales bacterium]